jgi:hypothetical protein
MILAIDVGLRNLAMCAMTCANGKNKETYSVHLWDVYNTLEGDAPTKCNATLKNGKVCGKKCTSQYKSECEKQYCCKTHFPKDIKYTSANVVKAKKVDQYLLQDITRIVLKKLIEIYESNTEVFSQVTHVLIELQPKINNKMKLISHIIYSKFVEIFMDKPKVSIRFVRASQKLKAYKGPTVECKLKGAYARRKFLSVEYTKWFLRNEFCQNEDNQLWLKKFMMHPKKDDLADTFLMAINGQ